MGCLSKMVFLMNILFIIIIDISFWSVGGWELGLIGIVSLIAFIIRWMISDSVDISYRDIFRLSEWGVFIKKYRLLMEQLLWYGLYYVLSVFC